MTAEASGIGAEINNGAGNVRKLSCRIRSIVLNICFKHNKQLALDDFEREFKEIFSLLVRSSCVCSQIFEIPCFVFILRLK